MAARESGEIWGRYHQLIDHAHGPHVLIGNFKRRADSFM